MDQIHALLPARELVVDLSESEAFGAPGKSKHHRVEHLVQACQDV
jgi:hypothetical protein